MPELTALWRVALCAMVLWLVPVGLTIAGASAPERMAVMSAVSAHDGEPFLAGVEMQLETGWKTYWKNPGDSGIAPTFDWSESENVQHVDLRWPAPQRFDDPGDVTFGYKDRVLWPLNVVPADAGRPVTLRVSMLYGVCSESICVPREENLALTIPPSSSGAASSVDLPALVAALSRLPQPMADRDALQVRWREAHAPVLEILYRGCAAGCRPPQLIIDGPQDVWFGVPAVDRKGEILRYTVEVGVLSTSMLEGERLGFLLVGSEEARIVYWTSP